MATYSVPKHILNFLESYATLFKEGYVIEKKVTDNKNPGWVYVGKRFAGGTYRFVLMPIEEINYGKPKKTHLVEELNKELKILRKEYKLLRDENWKLREKLGIQTSHLKKEEGSVKETEVPEKEKKEEGNKRKRRIEETKEGRAEHFKFDLEK